MAYIKITITEIGEGYVQYESVAAFITIDKEDYLLESMLMDNEDYQADLDVLNGFVGMWETRAESDGIRYEVDEGVYQRILELTLEADNEQEQEGIE